MKNDIVRKRSVYGTVRKDTTLRNISCFIAVLLLTLYLIGNSHYFAIKYDNGLMWLQTDGSVSAKNIRESVENPKELLSIMSPKKQAKRVNFDAHKVMAQRELKYRPIIEKYFPEEPEIMLAIAKAESSLNSNAIAYNCYYDRQGNVHTKRPKGGVSTFCKQGHEQYAWSKDGCAMQVNSMHGYDISTVEGCMKAARKVYDTQGKVAWVAYKSGAYKKYVRR